MWKCEIGTARTTRTPTFWDTPATTWLLVLVIHIRSQVKTRQSQSYKLKKMPETQILQETLHATHLLKLLDKMSNGRTEGQTDGQTDGWSGTNIPPQTTSLCVVYNLQNLQVASQAAREEMDILSASKAFQCERIHQPLLDSHRKRPVMQSFDIFFVVSLRTIPCHDIVMNLGHFQCQLRYHHTSTSSHIQLLTHWGRDEMNNISQTTFSNAFSSI